MEAIVGIGLERGRSVGETEGHNEVLKVSVAGTKRRLVFITRRNSELIVGVGKVETGIVLGILEAIEKF